MASSIIVQSFSSVNDTSIFMPNSTWARPITLPVGWKKVRLGVRYHISDPGTTLAGTPIPRFGVALCSGTTNILGDASVTNAIGVISTQSSWARGGVGFAPVSFAAMTYVGTTLNAPTNTTTNPAVPWVNTSSPCRQLFLIDIAVGSPNYVVTTVYWAPGSVGDVPSGTFYTAMLVPVPSIIGSTYNTDAPRSLAFSEATNGTLNAVNVWWNRTDCAIQVTDVAVALIGI
jgi:hypothetical protein